MDDSVALINALRGISNDNDGLGGSGGIWILLLFIILGGWGGRGFGYGGGGNGAGGIGGNELYPWLSQADQVGTGFAAVQQALCAGFGGVNNAMANGFAQAEIAANGRQMANMNQSFAMQTAVLQGFNGIQAQQSQCCCDNQLAMANQTAALLAEHCADRNALSQAVYTITANQTAGVQRIIDKMCDQELQAERRENDNLRQQINMMNLAASQTQQTAQILADNFAQTNALEQYLAPVPRPAYIVQNPNCCAQGYGYSCAA